MGQDVAQWWSIVVVRRKRLLMVRWFVGSIHCGPIDLFLIPGVTKAVVCAIVSVDGAYKNPCC